jgi:hypothetical protein
MRKYVVAPLLVLSLVVGLYFAGSALVWNPSKGGRPFYELRWEIVKRDFDNIAAAARAFRRKNGRDPGSLSELVLWAGHVLSVNLPLVDPWGGRYGFSFDGDGTLRIESLGADRAVGGARDDMDHVGRY